ncbi:MAG: TfoX/Sxy family protein [Candidatus Brocadiae bacterium]|nr:TfoX/Sxy family protein [Candidatus Brocadiia bacterium]
MPPDPTLVIRLREACLPHGAVEKSMFGGLAFMVRGHMACGILGRDLMARVGPPAAAAALGRPGVRPMDFTGRPLAGYLYVGPAGTRTDRMLADWVRACVSFVGSLPPRTTGSPRRRAPGKKSGTAGVKAAKSGSRRSPRG